MVPPAVRRTVLAALFAASFQVSVPGADGDGESVASLNERGAGFYEAGLFRQALECFEKARRLDPENPDLRANLAWAWIGLGLEFLSGGETARGAAAFRESLGVQEEPYAHFGLGFIDYLELRDAEARRRLEIALRLHPAFGKAHKVLALIEYRQKGPAEAIPAMEKAVGFDSQDREAAAILGRWKEEAKATNGFQSTLSRHFSIRYDPAISARQVELLARDLELGQECLGDILGVWPKGKIGVVLFTEEGFRRATGAVHWVGGLFDGQIKVPVSLSDSKPVDRLEVMRSLHHELAHALIKELYPACPNWLNEGLAQFLEIFPMAAADRIVAGSEALEPKWENAERLQRALEARRGKLDTSLAIERHNRVPFVKIPSRLWELSSEAEARRAYLQGLGFVDFLSRRAGAFRLRLLLAHAHRDGSLQKAFAATYGNSLDELEESWWASVPPLPKE